MNTVRKIALSFWFKLSLALFFVGSGVFLEFTRNRNMILPLLGPILVCALVVGYFSLQEHRKNDWS